MIIEGNRIIADEGKEIYNLNEPQQYGKTVTLGINDNAENWAEREETLIEIKE